MSLALMDGSLNSAPQLKEQVVQQLIRDTRAAVNRFSRVFAGNTSAETAAREMGQAQALLGMIYKYADKGYRPRLTAQMRYIEVYARMLERGKILSYGQLKPEELAALKADLEAELANAPAEQREAFIQAYAGRKLDEAALEMLNQGAAQLEGQLKDKEVEKITRLLDFLKPRKDVKTGKLKRGLMNAEAYRRLGRVTRMMGAAADEKAQKMDDINNKLAAGGLEQEEIDRLSLELLDWAVFGSLESMNLDATRAAGDALRQLVLTERSAWELKMEDEKRRLKKTAQDAVKVLGKADATEMRRLTEEDMKTMRKFGMMAENVMSFRE